VKGAFTGAAQERAGLLRTANHGVFFLDEVRELGLDEQAMLLRALEEKTFLPLGSDREVHSDFQLIAGTNRDLLSAVEDGRFREDLLARINLWTFTLPGLRDRREDLEPNLKFELDQHAVKSGTRVTFNLEARSRFLDFALSLDSVWQGNFRDLNAAVARMATLSSGGRISVEVVDEEIDRLKASWRSDRKRDASVKLTNFLNEEQISALDLFDRLQLEQVVEVCARSRSLSDAGRLLFNQSRSLRSTPNDADRLRKYLARFGLDWSSVSA
jgi:transcriptional regulatory protein RtcR